MRTGVILLLLMACRPNSAKRTTTLRIDERIRLLKAKIRNSLRNPSDPEPVPEYSESEENAPILPISESNELKKDDKFILKKLKTEPSKVVLRSEATTTPVQVVQLNERVTAISKSLVTFSGNFTPKPALDVFYRRHYNGPYLNYPLEWVHCSEHITPYFKGVKKELTMPRKTQAGDYIVRRVTNLLKMDLSKMGRSEKKSVMFQFSKMKIRLYSWDDRAKRVLLDLIGIKYGQSDKLDFFSLKAGLSVLIGTLNADLSNATRLLLQSKIFRPPCIYTIEQGKTKMVPGSTMPQPSLRTAESVECVRRDQNNVCIS